LRQSWSDKRIETAVAHLLRAGVMLAAALVLAGGALFLFRHGGEVLKRRTFQVPCHHPDRSQPADLQPDRRAHLRWPRTAIIAAHSLGPARIVTVFPDRMERYFTTDLSQPFAEVCLS